MTGWHLFELGLSSGTFALVAAGIWRMGRWQQRTEDRITYLENLWNGLYKK